MKISGRSNYKPHSSKDECGSPSYAIVPLINHIEYHRKSLGIKRENFVILEPAMGMGEKTHTGIVDGLSFLGYPVVALRDYDFAQLDIDFIQKRYNHYGKIRMIVTNPPFSVSLKRQFINRCEEIRENIDIPYALLMGSTTLVEKRNGVTLRGCSVHIPYGRICYNMPEKGWGTEEDPTKATFETNWYSKGLSEPSRIWYDSFDMSNHFDALKRFTDIFTNNAYFQV